MISPVHRIFREAPQQKLYNSINKKRGAASFRRNRTKKERRYFLQCLRFKYKCFYSVSPLNINAFTVEILFEFLLFYLFFVLSPHTHSPYPLIQLIKTRTENETFSVLLHTVNLLYFKYSFDSFELIKRVS